MGRYAIFLDHGYPSPLPDRGRPAHRPTLDFVYPVDNTPDMGTEPQLDEIRAVVRRHLPDPGYHAYLFGSRACGTARRMSDWDIGITGPRPLRGAVLEAIREDLESLRTLHSFEVVDLKSAAEEFESKALASAVQLL